MLQIVSESVLKAKTKNKQMLPKEVIHLGDGILKARPEFLNKILVEADIEADYIVEEKPFAR